MKSSVILTIGFLLLSVFSVHAQEAADSAAIRQTALDYIEGWYEANASRMERALHPELAKRIAYADKSGRSQLGDQGAERLIGSTRDVGGSDIPVEQHTGTTGAWTRQPAATRHHQSLRSRG